MKNSTRSILPALLAVGGGLASAPATAIELGEINIQSTLGQPLRASIAYALGPNEEIAGYCVSLNPAVAANGLPAITGAKLSVADGVIALTSKAAIREPLITLRLNIGCPYSAHLNREYMLFFDPAQPVATAGRAASSAPQPVANASRAASSAPTNRTPIDSSERYRVQPGDSLSIIAQRIENRRVGLGGGVAQIFDANPNAFMGDDPNLRKAGSWLVRPNFTPQAAFAAVVEDVAPVEPGSFVQETASTAYPGVADTAAVEEVVADFVALVAKHVPFEIRAVVVDLELFYEIGDELDGYGDVHAKVVILSIAAIGPRRPSPRRAARGRT